MSLVLPLIQNAVYCGVQYVKSTISEETVLSSFSVI